MQNPAAAPVADPARPAARIAEIKPFLAIEVFTRAQQMEAQGREILHLEFGEPDFPPPQAAREAGMAAIEKNQTRYTQTLGLVGLREAICELHAQRYGVQVAPQRVLVSSGVSVLATLALQLLLEPGDEVLLPNPCYACYANYVRLAQGTPVWVETREEENWRLEARRVERAITPRTRALLLGSPGNPTGSILEAQPLRELTHTLEARGIAVIADEIYHGLTYGGTAPSVLQFSENAFCLNGFSKYFAMTGWRLGYLIFPKALTGAFSRLHQSTMISAPEPAQRAGIAAILHGQEECEARLAEYDRRRQALLQGLNTIGLPVRSEPRGAFYLLADARRLGSDSLAIAMEILEETGVATTPGVDFGSAAEGRLRFSYANSMQVIEQALERLAPYVQRKTRG